jgi:hypothetical protein
MYKATVSHNSCIYFLVSFYGPINVLYAPLKFSLASLGLRLASLVAILGSLRSPLVRFAHT